MSESVPWTIKSVPVETRLKAVNAAKAADQTMGEWIVDVVNRATDPHTANRVIPPVKREPSPLPDLDLVGLAAAINATVAAMQAAGETPPQNLGKNAAATLNRYMYAARGLPERQTKRQTIEQKRQTLELVAISDR